MARGPGYDGPTAARRFQPERIFETLNHHSVRYVVIGAFAANLHGWPEATQDVDVTPDRAVRNMQRLAAALAEMESFAIDDEGEPIPNWRLDDQHLRMRGRTLVETRYGELDIVINPAGANGYADLVRDAAPYEVSENVTIFAISLRRVIESKEMSIVRRTGASFRACARSLKRTNATSAQEMRTTTAHERAAT